MAIKSWSAGEKLLASDLNANFAACFQDYISNENITNIANSFTIPANTKFIIIAVNYTWSGGDPADICYGDVFLAMTGKTTATLISGSRGLAITAGLTFTISGSAIAITDTGGEAVAAIDCTAYYYK